MYLKQFYHRALDPKHIVRPEVETSLQVPKAVCERLETVQLDDQPRWRCS